MQHLSKGWGQNKTRFYSLLLLCFFFISLFNADERTDGQTDEDVPRGPCRLADIKRPTLPEAQRTHVIDFVSQIISTTEMKTDSSSIRERGEE